jgi:hypothetical protein
VPLRDDETTMKTAATQELYAYWNALRGARPAPRREEIDPVAIPRSLPDIFILELQEGGRIAVRLAGTSLCDLYGRELRGSSLAELWTVESRREIDQVLRSVLSEAAIAVIAAAGRREGRDTELFELVVAPLADASGACRHVIGALTASEPSPLRGPEPIEALEARCARLSWPSGLRQNRRLRHDLAPANEARRVGRFMVYDGGLELADTALSTSR